MGSRHFFLAFLLGFGLAALAVPPATAAEADAGKVDKLIAQLGSDTFGDRQKAAAALDAVGEPALEALRKAAKGKDAEIRKRAADLVTRIETRVESARLLTPKQVHLVFKNTLLPEAVEEFRKQSGYNLVLHDPENKLKGRKITLDTGKTTFWNAFDLFCQKAGVVEGDPNALPGGPPVPVPVPIRVLPGGKPPPGVLPPAPPIKLPGKLGGPAPAPARAVATAVVAKAGVLQAPGGAPAVLPANPGARGIAVPPGGPRGGLGRAWVPVPAGQITLVPGKPVPRPTDATSAVRVRVADRNVFGNARDKEILLPLEVSPEPKIRWQRLVSVRIDKALDDNDQKLIPGDAAAETPAAGGPFGGIAVPPGGAAIMPFPGRGWMPATNNGPSRYAAVRLKKGEKASKSLKELTGTVAAEFQAEPEALVVATDVLKAAGKSFPGKQGGSFKVLAVEKAANGQLTIRFELEQPANAIPEHTSVPVPVGPRLAPVKGRVAPGGAAAPAAKPAGVPANAVPAPAPAGVAPGGAAGPAAKPAIAPAKVVPVPVPGGAPAGGVVVQIVIGPGGGFGGQTTFLGGQAGITLRDDKDKPLPASIQPNWRKGGAGLKMEYQVVYMPQKGHGSPTKLVFTGRRLVTVNVPFTLKDVKLP